MQLEDTVTQRPLLDTRHVCAWCGGDPRVEGKEPATIERGNETYYFHPVGVRCCKANWIERGRKIEAAANGTL